MRTAECTTPNHPDKLCDRISDAILDACLEQDLMSRVAIETMGGHGIITITGEMTTKADVNVHDIARRIAGDKYGIQTNIVKQSPEISQGVDNGGAGDQGIMVGYACRDNLDMIPQELYLARSLAKFLYEKYPYDGKTQITLDDKGVIKTAVASFQNTERVELEDAVMEWAIIKRVVPKGDWRILANPAGDWSIGGFEADTGLTGRKLTVDNYGPLVPVGGGAFSGKDATKVDRSAAYMARKIAVDYLKKNKGDYVFVQLAYAIGMREPVQATLVADGIGVQNIIGYDLTPEGIIRFLDLRKPQFEKTAEWGHFGNDFTWDF